MEPVNKKSLDREIAPKHETDDSSEPDDDESSNSKGEDEAEKPANKPENKEEKPRFGRKRRRASSSGVVTA